MDLIKKRIYGAFFIIVGYFLPIFYIKDKFPGEGTKIFRLGIRDYKHWLMDSLSEIEYINDFYAHEPLMVESNFWIKLFIFVVNNQLILILALIILAFYFQKKKILSRLMSLILLIFISFLVLISYSYYSEIASNGVNISLLCIPLILGNLTFLFGKD